MQPFAASTFSPVARCTAQPKTAHFYTPGVPILTRLRPMPEQAQIQTPQTLPKYVVEFLEEMGFSLEHEQVRKCVDSDFITAILVITGDYDYRVYKLAGGWRILHACWVVE